MNSITVDTCVWVRLIDGKDEEEIFQLLEHCKKNKIQIYSSSRVFSFDTTKMDNEQKSNIRKLMDEYGVVLDQAEFRLNASLLGSVHDETPREGLGSIHTSLLEDKFIGVFGPDPKTLNPRQTGKNLSNWIGDYDSLKHHYLNHRGLYVTYDTKIYMAQDMRDKAQNELDLTIVDPSIAREQLKA
ncbi:TPA: hypothetical protein ACPJ1X_001660 [Vibrio alginolyticus]|nr:MULTISPECIES: hypothetical protein [Vibrio]KIT39005.1 hypothetical protein H320_23355 [Vibrio parahaemolyticus 49]EGQ7815785.1 hypothetical protein [Vibrio parahaemolyticus]EGQ8517861.1 hypothetical protein [Vibrio parahaemolyticus]EGQ8734052.1 hypothetical protein [Vibrio parahaemolyticus]EGQ8887135.1 hypothetical protein [Vibrio parahaemolyticus]